MKYEILSFNLFFNFSGLTHETRDPAPWPGLITIVI
jgi:hypothetical protein